MIQMSLKELGLSPIEGQSSQAPYGDYWAETYLPAVKQVVALDSQSELHVRNASQAVADYTSLIAAVQDPNVWPVQAEPSNPAMGIKQLKNEKIYAITQWDETLGSLNVMRGGQGHMLRGAAIIHQENLVYGDDSFIPVDIDGFDSDYDAFMTQRRQNSLTSQKPNSALLKSAELVHKSAWIESEAIRREDLFGAARDMYAFLAQSKDAQPAIRRKAKNYLSDIVFHGLSEQLRTARQNENHKAENAAQRCMAAQIVLDARQIFHSYDRLSPGMNRLKRVDITGTIFEDVVPLALRTVIYEQGLEDREVRHAFGSEDKGVAGVRPKPGFDTVVQQYSSGQLAAEPVQLKYSDTGDSMISSEYKDRSATYLPGIAYVHEMEVTPQELQIAAGEMSGITSFGGREHHRSLAPMRALSERLGSVLLAS